MLEQAQRTTLQQLVRAELPGLYALARQLTRSAPAAEDLVQEALLHACRSFDSLRDVQAGPRWLRVILTNVWRDSLRHRDRVPREVPVDTTEEFSLYRTLVDEDPLPYSDTLHVDFVGAFSTEDVRLVLERLPEHLRVPLALRYVAGFTTGEIAELLDLPPGTVYSHLHRGRQAFERALWDYATQSGLLAEHPGAGRPREVTR
jgi:RNA polymerase sigma-70 factor (ECF subfamily)